MLPKISGSAADYNHALSREDEESTCATEEDAAELLASLALWAEVNGYCLKIPKPAYAEEVVSP